MEPSPSGSAEATDPPAESGTPGPTVTEPPIQGSALPNVTIPPWDGKERLNILLIGTDQRPKEGTYNTDTLIVVSIDPTTKQVAMFSLPRDSWGIPTAFRAAAQCVRIDIPGEDQLVLHRRSQPRGPRRRNRPNPRLQRP